MEIWVQESSLSLPEDARASFSLLKTAMFVVCSVHNVDSRKLVEEHEFEYRESISE